MTRRRSPIAMPSPHFMAFAPLDVWVRLLVICRGIKPRYWPRLGFALFTSAIGTALTLPERLVMAVALRGRWRSDGAQLRHPPGVIVIVGYFRSGTTHLHYLMSCDPRVRTPRWCETLAPQGFVLSWAFLRIFTIPFVSAKRPQDDVAIGPEWPAEDDFALCGWGLASSLPGRFIFPRRHAWFDRFHFLRELSERELRRWRFLQWAFCRKIAWLSGDRAILLKTPSHTARIAELSRLLGPTPVRFVHISRDPASVVRSNVAMAQRLEIYNLQDPDPGDDVQRRITQEYIHTERKYLDEAAGHPSAHIRYEDLIADPIGELRRIYAELGLAWSGEFESAALAYLQSVRDYTPAAKPASAPPPDESAAELQNLARRFGHDRPPIPKAPLPGEASRTVSRERSAIAAAAVVALICTVLWIGQAWFLRDRHDVLAWPTGVAIGLAAIHTARIGTVRLGLFAAAFTVAGFALVSIPATFLSDYAHRGYYRGLPMRDWEWYHILKASRVGSTAMNNLFWLFMGVVSAYRFASRKHIRPPGS